MVQTTCPSCGYSRTWRLRRNKRKCKKCRKEFSCKKYPVEGFRLETYEWKKIIRTFLCERTIIRIAEEANISQKTSQKTAHHLRLEMYRDRPSLFKGPVEMDETYIGGQRKNKKLHIRRTAAKRGHGTDKLPIVGIYDRASGQVIVEVEPRKLDVQFIFRFIQKQVIARAEIFTDGFKMYRGLTKLGFRHEFVDHDGGELVRGCIHTNNIEGFWGILKRKLSCVGGVRRSRLPLFVGEIVWRHNHRSLTLKEKEQALLKLILRQ